MPIGSLSTLGMSEALRITIRNTQAKLNEASSEAATGTHFDKGLALGRQSGRLAGFVQVRDELSSIQSSNKIAAIQLTAAQSALGSIRELADGFMSSLLASKRSGADRTLTIDDAKTRLAALIDLTSASTGGVYVFGGANISKAPLSNYLTSPESAARASVQSAFKAHFGYEPDDKRVSEITTGQMNGYLFDTFNPMFADASWSTTFSKATDKLMAVRQAPGTMIDGSVSANAPGVRGLYKALVAMIDTGVTSLNEATYDTLVSNVISTVGDATAGITSIQSTVGLSQESLAKANDRITFQTDLVGKWIAESEQVDKAAAAVRLNELTVQLQSTFAMTGRLQKLSLLEYL